MMLIVLIALILFFFFFASRPDNRLRLAWVIASLSTSLLILLSTEILSFFTRLNQFSLILFWGIVVLLVLAFLVWKKKGIPRFSWSVFENRFLNILSLLVPIILLALTFTIAVVSPPNNTDAMVYHLSRVAHWAQNQTIAFFPTSTLRELYLNPFTEYAVLQTYLLGGSDRFVNLVQWFSYLNVAILVSLISRKIGRRQKRAIFRSNIRYYLPQALLQSTTTQNDLVFSSMALMSVFFPHMLISQENNPKWIIPAGLCHFLAVLAKSTAFIVLTPFLVWTLITYLRHFERRKVCFYTALSSSVALILILPFYLRNWSAFGNPLGPASETALYRNEKIGVQSLVSNSLRNFAINLTYTQR